MITDDDFDRIVPGETQVVAPSSERLLIIKKMQHNDMTLLICCLCQQDPNKLSSWKVFKRDEYRYWTILEPTLDLEKLEPGKTILQDENGEWYRLFVARVGSEGILATEAQASTSLKSLHFKNVVYIPYEKCQIWTIVEE